MSKTDPPALVRLSEGLGPDAETVARVLCELDDTTNQTWRGKRARWAALVRAQEAEIARLKMELDNALPYMELHGKRLANDYRGSTSDATRREGEVLLEKVDLLRSALGPNVRIEPGAS